jgi:peptide chain release factor 1
MLDYSQIIAEAAAHAAQLEERLADPALVRSAGEYARVAKERSALGPLLAAGERYRALLAEIRDAREMLEDEEMRELAQGELPELLERREAMEKEITALILPKDPNDEKNVILEIRSGAGGEEAALFAADLFRMYSRYAEQRGWKLEPLSISETGSGGIKECIASVSGKGVYGRLKYERGVHRVQRVPVTESAGRIHTSTVTVAVMPEAEEVDVHVDQKDLRIDVFRASGPGGQSVNTTDSAVRITHLPSGIVVQCQDEKSQHKNKARAMKILRARLFEAEAQRLADERASQRRSQVGSGDRSEKIRTYNFPQSRVTDHRAGVTVHQLEAILEGELDELFDGVHTYMSGEREKRAGATN